MTYTRREFGQLALAGLPLARFLPSIDSKIDGVQIGVQTYSFRSMAKTPEEIVKAIAQIGLGEVELMSNHAEALAATPGRPPLDAFKAVRKKFDDAAIDVRFLCYNMNAKISDEDIDYGFQMAKALGAKAITTSTQVSVAKRVAPFADKHRMPVGYHNHSNLKDPNEVATPASFDAVTSYSKFHRINLDIGHFTAANFDPVAYIRQNHERITNLHIKDRKKDQGDNVPWGTGDTPIRDVLQLLKKEKWDIPANIEFEYPGSAVEEVAKCFMYCKEILRS